MKFVLLACITLPLFAKDITALANITFNNNPKIKELHKQIKAKEFDILNTANYKNPVVSIGVNDINLNDPIKRDIEAMQTQYINFSQEIVNSSKLHIKKNIEKYNQIILSSKLENEKNLILKKLYIYYFQYATLQDNIQLYKQQQNNILKIKDFHTNHINHKEAFQTMIQNDIMIENLQLQIIQSQEQIKQVLFEIKAISGESINSIESTDLPIFQNSVDKNHPLLTINQTKIQQAKEQTKLAQENKASDFTLNAGYYNRDSKDDYINLGIKIPLQIYSTEDNLVSKSLQNTQIMTHQLEQTKLNLEKKYNISYSKYTLADYSLKLLKKQNQYLIQEKEYINTKNKLSNILEILDLENKIIQNKILMNQQIKNKNIASAELSYLSSQLRINHE